MFNLENAACRTSWVLSKPQPQLSERGELLLWVLPATASFRRSMPSSLACLKSGLPKFHLKARDRYVRRILCACFTQKISTILNETQPRLKQCNRTFNVQLHTAAQISGLMTQFAPSNNPISPTRVDSEGQAGMGSFSASLIIATEFPSW